MFGGQPMSRGDQLRVVEGTRHMNSPARRWVVVTLSGSECEEYPGAPCVMGADGPHSRDEARQVLAAQPAWTRPHALTLSSDWPVLEAAPAGAINEAESVAAAIGEGIAQPGPVGHDASFALTVGIASDDPERWTADADRIIAAVRAMGYDVVWTRLNRPLLAKELGT